MKIVRYPARSKWKKLCARPVMDGGSVFETVREILAGVQTGGDAAVLDYSRRFDNFVRADPKLSLVERDNAAEKISAELRRAIDQAYATISAFHASQVREESPVETTPGVTCFRRSVPIDRVGLYIPGGTAPLFSTLLMLGVPARLAGCRELVLVTPPGKGEPIHPAIAYCAQLLGIEEIYLIGGAQAIGALAFGTQTIEPVYKICGPGNRFVNEAKMQVAAAGLGIDLPAGPSEVLVVADGAADPAFVAADLLAQAEHGPDSQVVLVTSSEALVEPVVRALDVQCNRLPRGSVAHEALNESYIFVVESIGEAIELSNEYAPEHLILNVKNADSYIGSVRNAGSVFLGALSPESLGDYASGTNHVLPTNGTAKAFSGVSIDTFVKKITFQRVTREGLNSLGSTVVEMARAEGLEAHAQAVLVRTGESI